MYLGAYTVQTKLLDVDYNTAGCLIRVTGPSHSPFIVCVFVLPRFIHHRNLSSFDFGDFYDNDPFLSDNSTNSWPTSGTGGLDLEILNALDDTWQSEFNLAIDDWENGNPDALTLTVSQGEVDYTCSKVDGLQKVCSGNFGDTGWLGINVIMKLTSNGEIQSSVAKMNEYYLRNAENAKRQYTMCHEIGHGFGLPHT